MNSEYETGICIFMLQKHRKRPVFKLSQHEHGELKSYKNNHKQMNICISARKQLNICIPNYDMENLFSVYSSSSYQFEDKALSLLLIYMYLSVENNSCPECEQSYFL